MTYPALNQNQTERLLRLPEVESRVSLRKSSIYAGVKAGTFPAPVNLSPRAVAWPESAIQSWIADRIKASKEA
jgi:prophage regulatory protein